MTNDEIATVIPSEVEESLGNAFWHRTEMPRLGLAHDDWSFVIRASTFLRHSTFDIRHSEGLPDKSADGKVLRR
jgi:hypothetical protein